MSLREDTFLLAYGGMHWGPDVIAAMPIRDRRWYVEKLIEQKKREDKAIRKK